MQAPVEGLHGRQPLLVLVVRCVAALLGVSLILLAAYYFAGELTHIRAAGLGTFTVRDAAASVGMLALTFAGALLVAFFPVPRRLRLPQRKSHEAPKPVYGFGTILAIGIGSTLGSPLFLLIPLNVVQYEIVSILSLVLATLLSLAMAKIYARNYTILRGNDLAAVGGPAFVRVAVGVRSGRYFVSRLSMAIANTALAAYCMIVFVLFDLEVLPGLLADYGIVGAPAFAIVVLIVALFGIWFVMNSILERRFIRTIGKVQIVFTSVLLAILVGQSYFLGSAGGWTFQGFLAFPAPTDLGWVAAILINTAYLYLLFFGFQEIQSLEQEALPTSRIPVVSWFLKGRKVDKRTYLGIAMIASVLIAAAVNVFYALAVYASAPSPTALAAAQIPALYVAESALGRPQEVLTAVAFMIATFTTFVPAFMAASRHIGALGHDGFLPKGVGRVSWLLVLVSIVFLAVTGEAFLVNITDFMVLVSLGIIALSAIWLRRNRRRVLERRDAVPLAVGVMCYAAAGILYGVTPSVAVFGSLSVALAFLIYDVMELGSIGSRLFVAAFCVLSYGLLILYPARFPSPGLLPFAPLEEAVRTTTALRTGLLVAAVGLLVSFLLELLVRQLRREAQSPAAEATATPQGDPPVRAGVKSRKVFPARRE